MLQEVVAQVYKCDGGGTSRTIWAGAQVPGNLKFWFPCSSKFVQGNKVRWHQKSRFQTKSSVPRTPWIRGWEMRIASRMRTLKRENLGRSPCSSQEPRHKKFTLWLFPYPRASCRSLVELISQVEEYGPQRSKQFLAVTWFPITVNVFHSSRSLG